VADVGYDRFEWSAEKASRNSREHLVRFEEAVTVFDDPFFKIYRSEEHSSEEDRYVIIGTSNRSRLLAVAFVERKRIRIISARKLTRRERKNHEEQE
jgi:uncharacterized DUF497 family protein